MIGISDINKPSVNLTCEILFNYVMIVHVKFIALQPLTKCLKLFWKLITARFFSYFEPNIFHSFAEKAIMFTCNIVQFDFCRIVGILVIILLDIIYVVE